MPSSTVFVNEDIQTREILSLTKYDPNYFIINLIFKQRKIKVNEFPAQFQNKKYKALNLEKDGFLDSTNDQYITYDGQK